MEKVNKLIKKLIRNGLKGRSSYTKEDRKYILKVIHNVSLFTDEELNYFEKNIEDFKNPLFKNIIKNEKEIRSWQI